MYTRHGHQIEGTSYIPRDPGMVIARCGGPGLCANCSRDAIAAQKTNPPKVVANLPVYMPGNNRNWEQVDAVLTIADDNSISLKLKNDDYAEELVEQARQNILWQVSFDYRMGVDEMDKINRQFLKYVPASEDAMYTALEPLLMGGAISMEDALHLFEKNGIKLMEEK